MTHRAGKVGVSAIMVNYNSGAHLHAGIAGLHRHLSLEDGLDEIIIVDNNSSDDSLVSIASVPGVRIVRSTINLGYGGGLNKGADCAQGDVLLFINPDATLTSAIEAVRSAFESEVNCAVVAPNVLENGHIPYPPRPRLTVLGDAWRDLAAESRLIPPTAADHQPGERIHFSGYSNGCAIFMRKSAFARVGRFDEDMFLYYEEADIFRRLSDVGYVFTYEPSCTVKHASGGSSSSLGWEKTAIRYNSKLKYFIKHSTILELIAHRAISLSILLVKLVVHSVHAVLHGRSPEKLNAYLYAGRLYLMGYVPWRASGHLCGGNVFDAKKYWEERLSENWGLRGVGCIGYGEYFNWWLYKVRGVVFKRRIRELSLESIANLEVLDIGSGVGFYLDQWKQLGSTRITGSDLTQTAVDRLRKKYNDLAILQLDIGGALPEAGSDGKQYDVVTAFDVLFHIVDNARFIQSLSNISELTKPNGYFLLSDIFPKTAPIENVHQVSRPLDVVCRLLREAGFRIVDRRPVFILMGPPLDTASRWPAVLWRMMMFPVRVCNPLGFVVGAIMFPIELMLTRLMTESPATEMLVCRKIE